MCRVRLGHCTRARRRNRRRHYMLTTDTIDHDDSVKRAMEVSAARRQFDELDADNDGVLCESEVYNMVK